MKFGTASIQESLCHGPGGWNYHTWFEWKEQEKKIIWQPESAAVENKGDQKKKPGERAILGWPGVFFLTPLFFYAAPSGFFIFFFFFFFFFFQAEDF